jgi:cytochrome d ubiquinol oxidase subunit II
VLPFIGKTDAERRTIVNTVGPTWDGNQVWLITAGGAIFAIWPRVYAASFSGLYFAFLIVLWALFFRPVAFEYRSKLKTQKWRNFWDWALFVGSFIPPLIVGVGIGNLFLGLPFQFDPESLRFFYGTTMTDASAVADLFKLLQPFALLCGLVSVSMMIMHGASYLKLRTKGEVYKRSCTTIKWVSLLLFALFAIGGLWIAFGINGFVWHSMANPMQHPLGSTVTRGVGAWLTNYSMHPWMIIAPVLGLLGCLYTSFLAKKDALLKSFIASGVTIFSIMATFGFSLFPFIMPSFVKPAQSLLVWNASSSEISLAGIIITAVIMLPIIFAYTAFVYKKLWGRDTKMCPEVIEQRQHELY